MKTTRVRAGLRIPYEMNTRLILLAKEMGLSKNGVIILAINDYLKKENNKAS